MFKILVATGRSAQQRSPTTLRRLRLLHSTVATRQSISTTKKLAKDPAQTRQSPSSSGPLASPPSISTASTNSIPSAVNDPDSNSKPTRTRTARKPKSPKPEDSTAENASPKRRKPRVSDRRKKVDTLAGIEAPVALENTSADTEATIHVHGKYRKPSFTTQNVRTDVLSYLKWAHGGYKIGKVLGDNNRLNIISQPLCDDIIERLGPSLQSHIGCDIIDVNPGAGIWSEKLHDFLKPRAHILLEPDQAKYQVLLQPLLNTPGSTYKLIPKSGVVWGHLEKILSKHHLPHQEPFERGDPRLEQRNDSLIFIANLGYVQKRGYGGFSSVANLVLYQLMSAIRAHSLFQRYGQVRMLIWIENGERDTILPRTISLRRKSAVEAEISCEKLEEVASSTDEIGHFTRENYLELERTRLVYEKMKEMGISVPTGRESTILKQLFSGNPRDMKEDIFTSAFLEEIHDLETRFAAGEFKEEVEIDLPKRSPRQLGRQKKKITPEFARLKDLRYRQSSELRKFETASEIKRELDKIYSMQREIQRAGKSKRYALEELKQRTQAWKERFSALAFAYRENISVMLDNDRAFETNPPTLAWDRREVEPLKVQPAEFYPHREMCLLDIQPKPIWPILQKNFSENYDILEYIIGQLFIVPTQTIKKGLSALAPGAYDYLIVECPSLSDPTRGGSLDVELMTVRRLTEEMLKEILEAWLRWPFKPTRFEVMRRLGSNVYDPDSIAVEELG